jgi:hypothetical protein
MPCRVVLVGISMFNDYVQKIIEASDGQIEMVACFDRKTKNNGQIIEELSQLPEFEWAIVDPSVGRSERALAIITLIKRQFPKTRVLASTYDGELSSRCFNQGADRFLEHWAIGYDAVTAILLAEPSQPDFKFVSLVVIADYCIELTGKVDGGLPIAKEIEVFSGPGMRFLYFLALERSLKRYDWLRYIAIDETGRKRSTAVYRCDQPAVWDELEHEDIMERRGRKNVALDSMAIERLERLSDLIDKPRTKSSLPIEKFPNDLCVSAHAINNCVKRAFPDSISPLIIGPRYSSEKKFKLNENLTATQVTFDLRRKPNL